MMTHRILILGGTTEARELAGRLAADRRHSVVLSLAGRTSQPAAQPVPLRVGGFGGVEGLAGYLIEQAIDLLIDATHPFAAQISANAAEAGGRAGIPVLALRRPQWRPVAGDRWIEVESTAKAVEAIGRSPKRVFVTFGRQELAGLATAPQHFYLVRSVDPVESGLDLPKVRYILDRGPFDEEAELALMSREAIEVVLAKNSGGTATYGKIAAARMLGIPVVLVQRPILPAIATVGTVEEALVAIDHLAASAAERGA